MAGLFAALLAFAGPTLGWWAAAFVALVPLIWMIRQAMPRRRQWAWPIYVASLAYWLLMLHGVRHAHPAMFLCWIALAAYLALYPVLFVGIAKRLVGRGVPLMAAALLAWLTQELVRNYFATGISVAMLGHTMADVRPMIQIANLGGTYLVSLVLVAVNVAVAQSLTRDRGAPASVAVAGAALAATLGYSMLSAPPSPTPDAEPARILLVQNDQLVDYAQDQSREVQIFDAYSQQTIESLGQTQPVVDVVVWPESMFNGGVPWTIADPDASIPEEAEITYDELTDSVAQQNRFFEQRADYVQTIAATVNGGVRPKMLVGCGVVRYTANGPRSYSGMIAIDSDGAVQHWYGKRHLVMFGEYIPLISHIPGLRDLIPAGLGVTPGDDASPIPLGDHHILPNICIETAVERVPLGAIADAADQPTDAIVTITNDRWFHHSSLVQHHLRCAQLVAVATGRPVLSAANGGPTAWIGSDGQVISQLVASDDGAVLAEATARSGITGYTRVQDWPHWAIALIAMGLAVRPVASAKEPAA